MEEVLDQMKLLCSDASNGCIAVSAQHLLQYVEKQLKHEGPFEIQLITMDNKKVLFSPEVWFSCLLRQNDAAGKFAHLLAQFVKHTIERCRALAKLKEDGALTNVLYMYVGDLLDYGKLGPEQQVRVDLGLPSYASSEQEAFLLSFPAGNGTTMQVCLDNFVAEQVDEGEVCAAHTLAPFFLKFFHLVDAGAGDDDHKLIDMFYKSRKFRT